MAYGRPGHVVMRAGELFLTRCYTLRRSGSTPCLGSTVELTLVAKMQVSRTQVPESRRVDLAPYQLKHWVS